MRHISEVLRLAAQGHSQREISSSVGISRTSVRNYLARAERAGLSWPLPDQVDAAVIESRLFKRTDEGVRSDRPEPDWLDVHREHKRGKHVTLQLLWQEYKQSTPEGYQYSRFCELYQRWAGKLDLVLRSEAPRPPTCTRAPCFTPDRVFIFNGNRCRSIRVFSANYERRQSRRGRFQR